MGVVHVCPFHVDSCHKTLGLRLAIFFRSTVAGCRLCSVMSPVARRKMMMMLHEIWLRYRSISRYHRYFGLHPVLLTPAPRVITRLQRHVDLLLHLSDILASHSFHLFFRISRSAEKR